VSTANHINSRLGTYRDLDVNETGRVTLAVPCILRGYWIYNNGNTTRYLKFYNQATIPTQTDTPKMTWPMPPGAAAHRTLPKDPDGGIVFSAGLALRATTGVADSDVGAPGANDVVVCLEVE